MPLTEGEWEAVKPFFEERTFWLLVPGRREAYAPLFEGTLNEAIAEALRHATFWETTTTVLHTPEGRSTAGNVPVAKVSPLPGSPLRRK